MTVQFIEIAGEKLAILPLAQYEQLLEAIEDQEDVAAAERAAQRRADGEEYLPGEMVHRLVDGENALRVWREYREFSLTQLAQRAGVNKSTLSLLENDKAHGRPATWRALADALTVTVDDILPLI